MRNFFKKGLSFVSAIAIFGLTIPFSEGFADDVGSNWAVAGGGEVSGDEVMSGLGVVGDNAMGSAMMESMRTVAYADSGLQSFFIKNEGQAPGEYAYYYLGNDEYVYFERSGVTFRNVYKQFSGAMHDTAYRMVFDGANSDVKIYGKEELPGKISYMIGDDFAKHRSNISTYKEVVYENLYDGIDLVFKFGNGTMKYEYLVEPGIDPSQIKFSFDGISGLQIDDGGELIVSNSVEDFIHNAPYVYQDIDGVRRMVDGNYFLSEKQILSGDSEFWKKSEERVDKEAGFELGHYDPNYLLVIDPVLANLDYSRFLGGAGYDSIADMEVDGSGNVYVYGTTTSSDFPATEGAYDTSYYGSGTDAFVAKYNPGLTTLSAATFIGAGTVLTVGKMSLDSSGNAYIIGMTGSGYPTTTGAYDQTQNGNYDIFVSELNSTLTSLTASTYIGGADNDWGFDIFVTAAAVYTLGSARAGYPTTTGAYNETNNGNDDVVISKFTTDLTTLSASTFFGTASDDSDGPEAIYVDGSGNVFICGTTRVASGVPTTPGAYDTTFGLIDGYISKFSSDLTTLSASTYLGTTSSEVIDVYVDGSGNVWVTGGTSDSSFPTTTGVYDQTQNGDYDVFVSELNSTLTSLTVSTFIGGSDTDIAYSIITDTSGNVYVAGKTYDGTTDYPTTTGAYDQTHNGSYDAFVSKLNSTLTSLTASTFVGSSGSDGANAVALNGSEQYVVIAGFAVDGFPVSTGANGGGTDGFVARFDNTPNTAPTAAINSVVQKTDGSGTVDVSVTADDADDDDTVKLKVEYKAGADCSSGTSDPTLDETDGNTTATYGDPKVENDNEYQVGNESGYITTSSGANTVLFDWASATDVPAANGTYCIKVTPSDGTTAGSAVTTTFTLDNVDPASLAGFAANTVATTSITPTWTAATDTNFDHYEIWYGTNQSDVQSRSGTAVEWDNSDDVALATATTATTTITGLSINVRYYLKIWAIDDYGNETTLSDVSAYTLANVPGSPTVSAISTTGLNFIIDQNSNPSNTTYEIKVGTSYVQANGTLGEGEVWQTYTTWGGASGQNISGLSANTQYTVSVRAKNGDSTTTDFSSGVSKYTYASPVTGMSLSNGTTMLAYVLNLTWTNAGQNGIKIDLSSVSGGACDDTYDIGNYDNASANPSSPRPISLSSNTCYKVRVGSYNGDGVLNTTDYAYSDGVTTPPAQPTGLAKSAASTSSITWGWTAVTDATNYKVYRNSDNAYIGQTGGVTNSYVQTTVVDGGAALSADTQYTVYVRAENANGEGIASSSASAYTSANTPSSPSHNNGVQAVTTMRWTWASGGAQKDFYAHMDSPILNSGYITDLYWTVSGSLSPNTQYTFYVQARNESDELTGEVSSSAYTSQATPIGMTFSDVGTDTITITAESGFYNLTSGSSGIRFQNTTTAADNTLTTDSWTNSSLSPNVQYSYTISGINGDGDETPSVSDSKYTLASVPGTPAISGATDTTLDVAINVNGNSAATVFAVYETTLGKYVQTDGTLGDAAVWQVVGTGVGQWGNNTSVSGKVRVSGLSIATNYEFEVKAKNGEAVETAYGTASSSYTLTGSIPAPTVNGATTLSLDVTIGQGTNPSDVVYKIYDSGTSKYVQADGTLDDVAVWQTASAWGTVSGVVGKITVTGLSKDTQYSFVVTPKTGGGVVGIPSDPTALYTLANVPGSPTVTVLSTSSLNVIINKNSNPSNTTYEIKMGTKYVQADGTLGDSEVWQDYTTWGGATGVNVTSLSVDTQYTVTVRARNGDSVATAWSDAVLRYILANAPETPTVTVLSVSSLNVVIVQNSNPSNTTYEIKMGTKYVQADGTLGDSEVWQAYTTWGGATGVNVTSLSVDTQYTVTVRARNGDSVATAWSSEVSKYTLANIPVSLATSMSLTAGVTVSWSANGNSDATEYYVQRVSDTSFYSGWTGSLSWVDSAATTKDVSYCYMVRARNGDHVETATVTMTSGCALTPGGGLVSTTVSNEKAEEAAEAAKAETPEAKVEEKALEVLKIVDTNDAKYAKYERVLASVPDIFEPDLDSDGDGVSNEDELSQGTDPLINNNGTISELFVALSGGSDVDVSIGRLKVVGVGKDGFAVTGTAKPGELVTVTTKDSKGEELVVNTVADENGNFIALADTKTLNLVTNELLKINTQVGGNATADLYGSFVASADTNELFGVNMQAVSVMSAKSNKGKNVIAKVGRDTIKVPELVVEGDYIVQIRDRMEMPKRGGLIGQLWNEKRLSASLYSIAKSLSEVSEMQGAKKSQVAKGSQTSGNAAGKQIIKGKATPGSTVIIVYKSVIYSSVVITDKNGNFQTEVPKELSKELSKDNKSVTHSYISFSIDYKTNKVSSFAKGKIKMLFKE